MKLKTRGGWADSCKTIAEFIVHSIQKNIHPTTFERRVCFSVRPDIIHRTVSKKVAKSYLFFVLLFA